MSHRIIPVVFLCPEGGDKVKVRVIKRYSDVMMGKIKEVGEVFEVSEQRGKYLIHEGVAVIGEREKGAGKVERR